MTVEITFSFEAMLAAELVGGKGSGNGIETTKHIQNYEDQVNKFKYKIALAEQKCIFHKPERNII